MRLCRLSVMGRNFHCDTTVVLVLTLSPKCDSPLGHTLSFARVGLRGLFILGVNKWG